jgi:ABC-2 type transport system ATP-binding protein
MMIDVSRFTMRFGPVTAVDDLSFSVAEGETFGFLGANGSGKTTTVRALLGAYTPTAGTLLVDGEPFSPRRSPILGYLPEERGVYPKERVIDVMAYFGRLKGLGSRAARAAAMELLERVGLADKAKAKVGTLSGGQQQKIQLATTMINDPRVLILDEPTKGLDPVNRRMLIDFVEERRAAGATVVLVTHRMEEAEKLCDRILLLKAGRAELCGTVEDIRGRFGGHRFCVTYDGVLGPVEGYRLVADDGRRATFLGTDAVEGTDLLRRLVTAGVQVERFEPETPSLEQIFLRVYSGEYAGDASEGTKIDA